MPATASASAVLDKTNFLLLPWKCRRVSLKLECLKRIHSAIIICGFSHRGFLLSNLLLRSLPAISHAGSGDLAYLLSLFKRTEAPHIRLCNAMISGFSTSSEPRLSVDCFARMRREGVPPDKHTFPLLLKALSRSRNGSPFQFHAQILKFGLSFDRFVQNSLVSFLANEGYVDIARKVFDEILSKDVIAWTAMIDGYVRNNFAWEAVECFVKMKSMDVEVDEVTIVSVLRAAGMMGDIWFGRWVHGFYVESGRVHWDAHVGSALVDMYSRCGYCNDACNVFEEMPYKTVVCWSTLIAGHVRSNRFRDALLIFRAMLLEKVTPNHVTLTSVLTACAQLGALDQGKWVHKYIKANELEVNSTLGTAMIDMYLKCGCVREACLVFEELPVKDVYPWTAMIHGFAVNGDALNSLSLFYEMLEYGIMPNEVTILGVLTACSHGGFVDEGRKLFDSMNRVFNLKPKLDHYGCMVDLLGRAGHLEEALKLIEGMPMEPTPGVWGALFGACMIQRAYGLGAQIGEHLIKLQPNHSGRYALLANLYSAYSNWEAAARIRKLMKWKGVEKTPGQSWTELNGTIHEFVAFDKSHAESMEVYSILETIIIQLEFDGCVKDTDLLMFDLDY